MNIKLLLHIHKEYLGYIHTCNASNWESEAGRSRIKIQPMLHTKTLGSKNFFVFKSLGCHFLVVLHLCAMNKI